MSNKRHGQITVKVLGKNGKWHTGEAECVPDALAKAILKTAGRKKPGKASR